MRKAIIFGILLFLLNSCSNHKDANRMANSGQKDKTSENKIDNPNPGTTGRIFEIKSGYVKYKNQVAGIDMIREWWFDDFGALQYEENYILAAGKKTGGAAMVRDGYRYEWNINSSEGTKDEFHASFINYENAPKEVIERFKMKNQGYETVAG
ncbi:MAG TPA: hypothetical protein PLB87_10365, partial [Prolixibacteraceae bacterium]|nr:hypothetical protein [Prolixibacteraceae bacterium]